MNASKKRTRLAYLGGVLACAALAAAAGWQWRPAAAEQPKAHALDGDAIGKAAGAKATSAPDGVVRLAWARTDVAVTVDGMPLKPFAGLGSWAAFTPASHGTM